MLICGAFFCDVSLAHEGAIHFFKVKAHMSKGHCRQPESWTQGNSAAGAAAKKVARDRFLHQLSVYRGGLQRAVCIQAHLVRTMAARAQNAQLAPSDEHEANSKFHLSAKTFLCKPAFRLRSKAPRVRSGYCYGFSVKLGEVEDHFISLCLNALPIPDSISQT